MHVSRSSDNRYWFRAFVVFLAVGAFTILSLSGSGSAHLPISTSGGPTLDTAFKIPDANVSYGVIAEFTSSTDRIQFYAFSVEAGHALSVELDVPAIPDLANFAPVILLMGPGLPAPDLLTTDLLVEFTLSLGPGSGAVSYLYNGTENVNIFEPFTQVNMWSRQAIEVVLPSQAVYYLAVVVPQGWARDANSGLGKYVLAPGLIEKFSVFDYMSIPLDWMRWHSFWEQSLLLFMLPTFFVVTVGTFGTWYFLRKRPSNILLGQPAALKTAFYLGVVGAFMMIGSAINQLGLLFRYTMFSFEVGDYIVLMLQAVGLVLGTLAFRMSLTLTRPKSAAALALALALLILVASGALIVGAGWIVGPVLFVFGYAAGLVVVRRSGEKCLASSI